MKISSLVTKLNNRYRGSEGFKRLTAADIVLAAGGSPDDYKSSDQLPAAQDEIIDKLVQQGKLPDSAIEDSTEETKAEEAQPTRRVNGAKLVLVERAQRPKSKVDEAALGWLRNVIEFDQQIVADQRAGRPYRPLVEATNDDLYFVYRDPMSHFLDSHEYSRRAGAGAVDNVIVIDPDKFALFQKQEAEAVEAERPVPSYQWRSNELLRKVERVLLGLWCAKAHCQQCDADLQGLRHEVKALLRGDYVLPDTPGAKPDRVLPFPSLCPWCVSLRREEVKLEVKLQTFQGTDEEAKAFRTQAYIDMIGRVVQKHEEDGASTHVVLASWRNWQRNRQAMFARVAARSITPAKRPRKATTSRKGS